MLLLLAVALLLPAQALLDNRIGSSGRRLGLYARYGRQP